MMASQADEIRCQLEILESKIASGSLASAESIMIAHGDLESELQGNELFASITRECQETFELWETNCEVLFETVVKYNELVHTLIEKMKDLETQNSRLNSELEELIEKYRLLDKRVKELEGSRLKLMAGQLAFEINRVVVHKVLADILDPDLEQIDTIGDMEKAIKGNSNFDDIFDTEEDMKKAEKKWETLKRQIHWKGVHFRYLKKLKRFRVNVAHPLFDPEAVKQALKNGTLQVPDMELFKECLMMYERLCY